MNRLSKVFILFTLACLLSISIRHLVSLQGFFGILINMDSIATTNRTMAGNIMNDQKYDFDPQQDISASARSPIKIAATMSQESAKHFLDCNKINSTCRYFYPVNFFDNPRAWGYEYRHEAQRELYGNLDRLVPVNWIRFWNQVKIDNNQTYDYNEYPPADFTYIHIRKAGGMTVKYMGFSFCKGGAYRMEDRFTAKSNEFLRKVGVDGFTARLQDMARKTQFFTFYRNPISRFLSGLGQVVAMRPDSVKALNCTQHPSKAPPADTIRCVLDAFQRGDRVDEHLTRASHELYQTLHHVNSTVRMIPLQNMTDFMQSIHITPFSMNSKKKYTKSDLDEQMLKEICEYYAVDVHMVRLLGMDVTECDRYVPWKSM